MISVAIDADGAEVFTLGLFDINGREVMSAETRFNGANQVRQIDLSQLPSGVYHLRAVSSERSVTKRVVKY
jgi:hypothetical protein